MGKKILILDGTPEGNVSLAPVLAILRELVEESGAEVTTISLRGTAMAHCIGCFNCWIKTPGICIADDSGRDSTAAVAASDTTIFFSPVIFGGYSSLLKRSQERRLPLTLPFFEKVHGEIHHAPRYPNPPRVIGIGVQEHPDEAEAALFKIMVGRNALNSRAPSFAADVIMAGAGPEVQREQLRSLLTREDPIPLRHAARSIMPPPVPPEKRREGVVPGRALLIVGSPKIKSPSTSALLGGFLLNRLEARGWQTETVTLRENLLLKQGEAELLSVVNRADLLILAFPLYVDSVPCLLTRAMEQIAADRRTGTTRLRQRCVALSNSGFPEAWQNATALAICRHFALKSGMTWAGGLALGAGEALCSGDPESLIWPRHHLRTKHLTRALDIAAKALAEGQPVPAKAQQVLETTPIPLIPFPLWTWLFVKLAGRFWRKTAAENGVTTNELLRQPYLRQHDYQ